FAVVNAAIFRPVSVADLDGVSTVQWMFRPPPRVKPPGTPEQPPARPALTGADFRAFQARPAPAIDAVTSVLTTGATARGPSRLERVSIEAIAGGYSRVFGIVPAMGRFVDTEDDAG